MKGSRRGRLLLASAAVLLLLGLGLGLASQSRFGRSLSAALLGREGGLVETPSTQPGPALVVFYSGDGGWARAAAAIAEGLARRGAPTVGVDSLRYFWPGRTPTGAAADLAAVIARYRRAWRRDEVVLAGYSFGADALPVLWPYLPAEARRHVRAVVLIGASASAEMEVRPRSWLDIKAADAIPIAPLLARMTQVRTACVYGASDKVTACAGLPVAVHTVLPGGHHFNGDYRRVDDAVLSAAGL